MQQHNQGTPRYDGPRELAQSLTALAHMDATQAAWNREGLREDSEYRDLGLAAVTNGRIGVKHIRALKPLTEPTGWHWHDMTAHFLYVLRGSITFRFAGVAHNVISRSDDLEVLEINEPAVYGTWDLAEPPAPWK